ncbi:MAG: hypothetical protein GY939_04670, partial [Actinomycetia bacterium]|nr:hypothetical protein [Actinomycetes bacterium]
MTTATDHSNHWERGGIMFTKKLRAALALTVLAALTVPLASPASAQVSIDLCATTGSVTMPDAAVVPVWSYVIGDCTTTGNAVLPGEEIRLTEGNSLSIDLYVDGAGIGEPVSLIVPTLPGMPDVSGTMTGPINYSWAAGDLTPGTHLYESGVNPGVQVPMGLSGAIVVESATPSADVDQVLVLSELDVDMNASPGTFNRNDYAPEYFLINGKAAPQVPAIAAVPGQTVLLRYVNVGSRLHSMAVLGARQTVVAREGRPAPLPRSVVAELVAPGHTIDAEIEVTADHAESRLIVYNRNGFLNNNIDGVSTGGMQLGIHVGPVPDPPPVYISLDCGSYGGAATCGDPALGDGRSDLRIFRVDGTSLVVVFDGWEVMTKTGNQKRRDPAEAQIDGFAFLSHSEILVSFNRPMHYSVFGMAAPPDVNIDDNDVLLFTATSLGAGAATTGDWSYYFDGSDVEFGDGPEDVNGIALTSTGELLLSTRAPGSAQGVSFDDSDVVRFVFDGSPGEATAGSFYPYFDGSTSEGTNGSDLAKNSEDLNGISIDPYSDLLHFTTTGNVSVAEAVDPYIAGDHDVSTCIDDPGGEVCDDWAVLLDGNPLIIGQYDIQGVEVY